MTKDILKDRLELILAELGHSWRSGSYEETVNDILSLIQEYEEEKWEGWEEEFDKRFQDVNGSYGELASLIQTYMNTMNHDFKNWIKSKLGEK